MNRVPLAILLATYNSTKYLAEQLDSLFAQSYADFTLFVKDDGSTDHTLEMIRKYQETHPNIVILEDEVMRRGAMNNFFWLLENVEADYYMFCDHDDIWLPNKIEITRDAMLACEKENPGKSVLVNTDVRVVDKNLDVILPSYWKAGSLYPDLMNRFHYLMLAGFVTGSTAMINRQARKIAFPVGKNAYMHDAWIAMRVVAEGGVLCSIDTPTVLYRQHENNVLGVRHSTRSKIVRKIASLPHYLKANRLTYRMAHEIGDVSIFTYVYYKLRYRKEYRQRQRNEKRQQA